MWEVHNVECETVPFVKTAVEYLPLSIVINMTGLWHTLCTLYVRVESEARHPKQTVLEKRNTGTALDVTQPATTCFDSDLTTWAAVYTPTAMAIIYLCIHVHAYTHASETEDL